MADHLTAAEDSSTSVILCHTALLNVEEKDEAVCRRIEPSLGHASLSEYVIRSLRVDFFPVRKGYDTVSQPDSADTLAALFTA